MNNLIRSFLVFGGLCISLSGSSQNQTNKERKIFIPSEPGCVYHADEYRGKVSIPVSEDVKNRMSEAKVSNPCSTFFVNYVGFTPEAQAAFQYAVDIWAASLDTPRTVRINATFTELSSGTLGSAGANGFVSLDPSTTPGAVANVFYPVALAEKLLDDDINSVQPDIAANFNNQINWYFGLDANPPSGQFDFVSVVLHELGHGLGFQGFGTVSGLSGRIRSGSALFPSIYDTFTENGDGVALLSFEDPSVALGMELTSENLFSNSLIAAGQLDGVLPKIWAPLTFSQGSSYSHWDENVFNSGGVNSLMTPNIAPGEAIHDPGAITLGLFEDMGWSLCGGSLSTKDVSLTEVNISPNPFTSTITINLVNGFDSNYKVELIDINGRIIFSERKSDNNNTVTISNLDNLDDALYFVKITDSKNGSSITRKVIKN